MRKKASAKQSDPMMKMYGRPVVYNRDIFIEVCERITNGEDFHTICSSPGMPLACVFRGWIEDHKEGRAIYRSACDLKESRGWSAMTSAGRSPKSTCSMASVYAAGVCSGA